MGSLEHSWNQQSIWSTAANQLKSSIDFWRNVCFVLAVLGAVLETLAATTEPGLIRTSCAFSGVFFLGLIPIFRARFVSANRIQSWTGCRSVSEGLKSEVYRCCARGGDYASLPPDECIAHLRERSDLIENEGSAWSKCIAGLDAKPGSSAPASPMPREQYVEKRIKGQVTDFFEPRAKSIKRRMAVYQGAELTLSIFAAGLAAAAGIWGLQDDGSNSTYSAWVAVVTTITGAIAAHVATARFEQLRAQYSATAEKLKRLDRKWQDKAVGNTDAEWGKFVQDCEDVLAMENASWLASWNDRE